MQDREGMVETTHPRALVPAVDARRPSWPPGADGRRPSGADRWYRCRVPRSVWVWAGVLVLGVAALVLLAFLTGRPSWVQAVDRAVRDLLFPGARSGAGPPGFWQDLDALGAGLGYRVVWVPTVLVLVWARRWRHLLVYLSTVSLVATLALVSVGDHLVARTLRTGLTGSADHVALPAWPVVVLAAVATGSLYALTPSGPARRWGWTAVAVLVGALALARVGSSLDSASAAVVSALVGSSAAALVASVFAPERAFPVTYDRRVKAHLDLDAQRRDRVLSAVRDQLGIEATELEPFRLDGSAGSTPCRLRLAHGPPTHLFGKLYATTHLRSDRWYKYARVLRYGRLEDEAPFSSVRRLVEHEDYMLRLLRDGGVQVPEPVGVVEVVPGQEYLLVSELVPDSVEVLESGLGDAVIDDALRQVRRLWAAGAAHRDVKPSNVLAQGDRVFLVDVSFGELRPSRWRQSVDLANMLLTLAVVAGPERVLGRAAAFFSAEELAEAFATTGSVTVPRQLQRMVQGTGRDLVGEFRALLPPHPRISVQRWSLRRVLLAVTAVCGVAVVSVLVVVNLRAGGLL
ncbi:hypothetical protein GCM10023328_11690 [Modestobacter marinus]|uniref:non-specific serine/threonine protein kinase n=1 Tax=Modestobacter marinus TaxID=477641 RepID=A0A846LNQ9_9ACTN|nr:RIO1 family regulatory kinase/ATPase [Modestobacter marinus]NIH69196.1 hypothetical protein [Modestobacter marinus]GGL76740.1 hypothetical protein GCM10011589_36040 [Modestobacter marinus]